MFSSQYIQERISKAQTLRDLEVNPYSNDSRRDTTVAKFLNVNSDVQNLENSRDESRVYTVAGRIKFFRLMGKASFLKIEDESGILQIYVARDNLPQDFYNKIFKKNVEVGDIIEVTGFPFMTKKGELTLSVNALQVLSKAISPLPEKYHGIQDKELRYRQRYLDLIMNSEVKKTFHMRSKI
ncbi:MAG: OB-fold nucleic acid binding domain-containing protein, partial [Campylobacterota bacterium]